MAMKRNTVHKILPCRGSLDRGLSPRPNIRYVGAERVLAAPSTPTIATPRLKSD
jgi:hypothetical protein